DTAGGDVEELVLAGLGRAGPGHAAGVGEQPQQQPLPAHHLPGRKNLKRRHGDPGSSGGVVGGSRRRESSEGVVVEVRQSAGRQAATCARSERALNERMMVPRSGTPAIDASADWSPPLPGSIPVRSIGTPGLSIW